MSLHLSQTVTETKQILIQAFNPSATTKLCTVALGAAALTLMGATAEAASFSGLGDLPGGRFFSAANAVSADGSVVVGVSHANTIHNSSGRNEAFRWTEDGGMVGLGGLDFVLNQDGQEFFFPGRSRASGVSADGSVVMGTSSDIIRGTQVFRWTAEDGMVSLAGPIDAALFTIVEDGSADGSVAVGRIGRSFFSSAWLWSTEGGRLVGPLRQDDYFASANGVSADGSVVVGNSLGEDGVLEAFLWNAADDSIVGLGFLEEAHSSSIAYEVSADGTIVVGNSDSSSGNQVFRWTEEDGMVGLGSILENSSRNVVTDLSADASVMVGTSRNRDGTALFIWDERNGMRALPDVLTGDFGLDLTGWVLDSVTGISADGLTLVGSGTNPDGNTEAWIARLDPVSTPEPSTLLGLSTLVLMGGMLLRRKN